MLNGNTGIMKSMMAELTDETNMARGFALIPVTWAIGGTIGFDISLLSFFLWLISTPRPFIGGVLSRPQDRLPQVPVVCADVHAAAYRDRKRCARVGPHRGADRGENLRAGSAGDRGECADAASRNSGTMMHG